MRRKIKTVMEQMNAEKPDDVLADLERKHGCASATLLGCRDKQLSERLGSVCVSGDVLTGAALVKYLNQMPTGVKPPKLIPDFTINIRTRKGDRLKITATRWHKQFITGDGIKSARQITRGEECILSHRRYPQGGAIHPTAWSEPGLCNPERTQRHGTSCGYWYLWQHDTKADGRLGSALGNSDPPRG